LNSPKFLHIQDEFQSRKKRPDREFWMGLCMEPNRIAEEN